MHSTRTLEPSSMSSYQIVRFVHISSGIFPATTEFAGHTAQNLPPTLHHAGQLRAIRGTDTVPDQNEGFGRTGNYT